MELLVFFCLFGFMVDSGVEYSLWRLVHFVGDSYINLDFYKHLVQGKRKTWCPV